MKKSAVLLIDVQANMFGKGRVVYRGEDLLKILAEVVGRARKAGLQVFYAQHNGQTGDPDEPGSAGWEIHAMLTPREGELVFQKRTQSAFHGTALHTTLQAHQIERLVIMGLQTEFCVDTTVRHAYNLGYEVLLVQDGHSTYNSETLTAAQIITHHNNTLEAFADVVEASDVEF
jgi:nicotinamidase-related amidase